MPATYPSTSLAAMATLLVSAVSAAAAATTATPPSLPMVGYCNVQTAQLHDNWLGMYCNTRNVAAFAYDWAWINLDWCVANRNGHLVARQHGSYHGTCTHCAVQLVPAPATALHPGTAYTDGHTLDLRCTCRDAHGRSVASTFDLNNILMDVDGALGCYGRLGNKTEAGPAST